MKARPIAATLFVLCCLLLCGVILRHQIAAHPLPPEPAQRTGAGPDFPADLEWSAASPAGTREGQTVLRGYLTALHNGDAAAAADSRSSWLRQRFRSPEMFLSAVKGRFPELIAWHHLAFGPVWTDSTGQYARARVLLDENDGTQIRGMFLLVREDKQLKIGWIRTERVP